jgi:hypothetical protein
MAARAAKLTRVVGPGSPPAKWVDAREARAAEGGLRAPFRGRHVRPTHPRVSQSESEQQWIA